MRCCVQLCTFWTPEGRLLRDWETLRAYLWHHTTKARQTSTSWARHRSTHMRDGNALSGIHPHIKCTENTVLDVVLLLPFFSVQPQLAVIQEEQYGAARKPRKACHWSTLTLCLYNSAGNYLLCGAPQHLARVHDSDTCNIFDCAHTVRQSQS